ncbi:MAG: DUF5615 family PIN-like protein [Deinococcota bacterium]
MRFLVDAQLPPALARWLSQHGHEAEHVQDCGLADANDLIIWEHALTTGATILTKDEDFAHLRTLRTTGPAVVWLRIGNTRKVALLRWMEALLPELIDKLERGEMLVEVS